MLLHMCLGRQVQLLIMRQLPKECIHHLWCRLQHKKHSYLCRALACLHGA